MKAQAGGETLESMSQAVWYNQWTLGKFSKYLSGEILEIGCGIGNFTNSLIRFGDIWAIDINKNYIRETEQLVNGQAKIGFGDIESGIYFFGKKKFDCIVCINVLEHIKRDKQAFENLGKLLKAEGYLILLVPAHDFLFSKLDESIGHYRRYSMRQLYEMIWENGLTVLKSWKLNFLGAIGWFIAGKFLNERKVNEEKIKIFNFFAPLFLRFENLVEPHIGTSILIIVKKGKR